MALSCALISAAITIDCDNPTIAGIKIGDIYIANHSEIDGFAQAAGTISAFTFASGKGFKKYSVFTKAIKPSYRMRKGSFKNAWEHQLGLTVHLATQAVKNELEALANAGVVAVYVGNTNNQIEVLGLGVGLEAETIERDLTSTETDAAFVLDLKTGEYSEPRLPQDFYDTSYTASIAALDAYIV